MTTVLCDTSIVLKWFHELGEQDVDAARGVLEAHRAGRLTAAVLELTFYELGNVLLRSLGWTAVDVAGQLADLRTICPVIDPAPKTLTLAAELAETHGLTFYDALYGAAAKLNGATLLTADIQLLECGLGSPPPAVA